MISRLLDSNEFAIDINAADEDGQTAVHRALILGKVEIVHTYFNTMPR